MEIPAWINMFLAFCTALALPIIFMFNVQRERRKHKQQQRSYRPGRLKLLCAATKSTATIAGCVGVWVVFLWTLNFSVASFRSANLQDQVLGIVTAVIVAVVAGAGTAIAVAVSSKRLRDLPTTDNDN